MIWLSDACGVVDILLATLPGRKRRVGGVSVRALLPIGEVGWGKTASKNAEGHSGTTYTRLGRATIGIAVITWDRAGSSTKGREKRAQRVAAQLEPPQRHNRLHNCTGRGHIGWEPGEVVPGPNHAGCLRSITNYMAYALFPYHIRQNTDTNPYAKFPQVFFSHRCSIPTSA